MIKKLFILLFGAAVVFHIPQLYGGNLLKNSSFEVPQEQYYQLPENWILMNKSGNTATGNIDSTNSVQGSNSVLLRNVDKKDRRIQWAYKNLKSALDKTVPAAMELSVYVYPQKKPAGIHIFFESPSAKQCFTKYEPKVPAGKWTQLTVKFNLPQADYRNSHVVIQLVGQGEVLVDCVYFGKAGKNPYADLKKSPAEMLAKNYCRLKNFPVSSRFISGKVPEKLTIETFLPGKELFVTLSEIEGSIVKQWFFKDLPVNQVHSVDIEIPYLAESAYELKYSCGDWQEYDWFKVGKLPERGAYFNKNGFPVIDGKTIFPIGVITPAMEMDAWRVYSQSGINMISPQTPLLERDFVEYVSEYMEKFDLYWFLWNGWGVREEDDDALRSRMSAERILMQQFKRFAGFFADELMWGGAKLNITRRHYKYMLRYLPEYLAWINHAPRLTGTPGEKRTSFDQARRFSRSADFISVDIYPVPDYGHNNLPNRTISCVGDYADMARELVWDEKPLWMVLQAFSWADFNKAVAKTPETYPSKKQLRFMAWNAITHGAKGIFWYGRGCKEVYTPFYQRLAEVNLEISAVAKMMISGRINYLKGLPSGVSGISGKGYKVYVNENKHDCVTVEGKNIEPHGVLIITEKALNIPEIKQFVPQKVDGKRQYRFPEKMQKSSWISCPGYQNCGAQTFFTRQEFELTEIPQLIWLNIAADDRAKVFINGKELLTTEHWQILYSANISSLLKKGKNIISAEFSNIDGANGLVYEIISPENKEVFAASGTETMISPEKAGKYTPASVVAPHGKGVWGLQKTLKIIR